MRFFSQTFLLQTEETKTWTGRQIWILFMILPLDISTLTQTHTLSLTHSWSCCRSTRGPPARRPRWRPLSSSVMSLRSLCPGSGPQRWNQ